MHLLFNQDGYTALILASLESKSTTVELLLGAGANKEAKDNVRVAQYL